MYIYIYVCICIYIYMCVYTFKEKYIHLSLGVNVLQLLSMYSQLKGSQNLHQLAIFMPVKIQYFHQLSNTNWCIEVLIS